ncbi:type II secretion system F family protein [Limnobacter parvus]|uniref:Type II secretion system F family protein n=1 Tax=Limnobacter parvus TaxID=2939690 RepID=A0ABT1XGA8_9BURK|nr:type II secretion system F family protein [Limnobacter parvus]MCR2745144.1 type II secretion system F family protein [Limnobacter parvus]
MNINFPRARIKALTWQTWMGQWAELIQSGMPVLDALTLSTELQGSNKQSRLLQARLMRTTEFLQQGQSLQTAFRAACGTLPLPLEVALLCAQANGDLGGSVNEQLHRWKVTSEASQALGRSLIYPGVVLLLAIACWVFLHQVSSPHLATTHTNQTASSSFSDGLLLLGAGLLLAAGVSKAMKAQTHTTEQHWMPHKAWLASNFYHVIACELQAGLDLMHCLRFRVMPPSSWSNLLTQEAKTTLNLNQMMTLVQRHLKQGMNLAQAMQQAKAPSFLVRQSQLAEQTGNLAYCFFLASKVYEIQARDAQRKLQSVLPPLALGIAALTLAMAYQFTLAPLYGNLTGLS